MRILLNTLYVTTPEAYFEQGWAECCCLCKSGGDIPYTDSQH